jgi:pimeloyl-ACP methyl ester carboxylesterase
MTEAQAVDLPTFIEHRVPHGGGSLYVRDFAGEGPAFVLLHGFPDNLHIYDDLVPHLVAAGRRTVAFDFLGFGASDKPEGAAYSFEQQVGDLEAVVVALGLAKVMPVGHDAGGPTAVGPRRGRPDCGQLRAPKSGSDGRDLPDERILRSGARPARSRIY